MICEAPRNRHAARACQRCSLHRQISERRPIGMCRPLAEHARDVTIVEPSSAQGAPEARQSSLSDPAWLHNRRPDAAGVPAARQQPAREAHAWAEGPEGETSAAGASCQGMFLVVHPLCVSMLTGSTGLNFTVVLVHQHVAAQSSAHVQLVACAQACEWQYLLCVDLCICGRQMTRLLMCHAGSAASVIASSSPTTCLSASKLRCRTCR